jgi:hypothetical protein
VTSPVTTVRYAVRGLDLMNKSNFDDAVGVCHELFVAPDVCMVRFSSDPTTTAEHIGYTSRREMVIVHYTQGGEIASIELVGDDKPCQQPTLQP